MDDVRPPAANPNQPPTNMPIPTTNTDVVAPASTTPLVTSTPAPRAAVPPAPTVPLSQPVTAPAVQSSPVQESFTAASPTAPALQDTPNSQLSDESSLAEEQKPLPNPNQPKSNSHLWPIIIAVLVALGLIAGAGYAYWQNHQKANNSTTSQTSRQSEDSNLGGKSTTTKETPATTKDITDATNDIQKEINKVDDSKDANEKDLSDQTLGIN